ncbi:hypothetical protein [Metabacillus dongyingensis]|uniref:hypothetical protein n=1 Tax=Metabacillus dongyingensis TaxID=2874282 RepID=UPI001CC0C25A|nr:hypothetical protein [Metabacillus dongyingensis]UAL53506.1 hypothetical protein K8L98_06895 [Metabacillus dongyingensis]
MYILQFINYHNQQVIKEVRYESQKQCLWMITDFEASKGEECFIFDDEHRTISAIYESNEMTAEGNDTVYKLFFKASLAERQVPIRYSK